MSMNTTNRISPANAPAYGIDSVKTLSKAFDMTRAEVRAIGHDLGLDFTYVSNRRTWVIATGLTKDGDPQEAIVIVYLYEDDFESSIEW